MLKSNVRKPGFVSDFNSLTNYRIIHIVTVTPSDDNFWSIFMFEIEIFIGVVT